MIPLLLLLACVVGLLAAGLALHDSYARAAETERQIRDLEAAEAESRRLMDGAA